MQNDEHDTMSVANWNKTKVIPECDWLQYPEGAFDDGP
jgi:hypothetical protein